MHQKSSLVFIISISIAVIASWIFLIVPDLKNSTEYFGTLLAAEGQSRQANSVGGELGEPILHQIFVRQQVIEEDGNILKIKTLIYDRDIVTKENFWEYESVDLIDRTTRKFVEKEDVYYISPYNIQKQDYNFWMYVGGVSFETKFVKTDYLKNLEVYVFESKQTLDTSGTFPQFPTEQIEKELTVTFFVEPITGKFVAYEAVWKDWIIKDGEKILILDAFEETTQYSRTTEAKTALDQIQLFYLYDTVIPIFLVAISAGSILVVFVNQNLRTRTKELKQTKEIDKLKEEFVAMITHDLKQPLVVISGNAEMLAEPKMGELNEMQKESVGEIAANVSLQLSMIDNLVTAQKLGAGAMKYDIEELSSKDLLNACIKTHSPIMHDKNIDYFDSSTVDIKIKVIENAF